MRIGLPKEIKNHEYRVGLTPASVHELVMHGHEVWVQAGAGAAIGLTDEQYVAAGASLVQIYSGFIYKGPALIREAVDAIAALPHKA